MAAAHTQNMRWRSAFVYLRQYKTWIAQELQNGSVITPNIPVG
jgi:hypothetical protein